MQVLLLAGFVPLLAACASDFSADTSTEFGPASDKAIVILGTSASAPQIFTWSGASLSSFWQRYDPAARRLIRNGDTLQTKVLRTDLSPFVATDYREPTMAVLEVEPGDYALIAAGFPHQMTIYVRSADGRPWASTKAYIVDPRKHVDPEADINPQRNFVFSVDAGQIAYIGHFEFVKLRHTDSLGSINYSLNEAAAHAVLEDYPGITGDMVTRDLSLPTEQALR